MGYFNGEHVKSIVEQEKGIAARVEGTRVYEVGVKSINASPSRRKPESPASDAEDIDISGPVELVLLAVRGTVLSP